VTLPSRPLYFPRTIRTSSSFRTGSDRACYTVNCQHMRVLKETIRTWYLLRNSFDNAEDIILRRTEEGAEKCILRDLRRDEETSVEIQDQYTDQTYDCTCPQVSEDRI